MKSTKHPLFGMAILILIFLMLLPVSSLAGDLQRILVLPFEIRAENDLTFLQNSMEDMLFKRLSRIENVHVKTLETKQSNELKTKDRPSAIQLAKGLSADYLLTGSLTVFGNSINTDAEFMDVQTGMVKVSFNEFSKNRDDVFEHMALLTERINKEVFSHKIPDNKEKNIQPLVEKPVKQPVPEEKKALPRLSWKSQNFETKIISLAIGNLDGGDEKEAVFTSENKLHIYRFQDEALLKVREIETPTNTRIISVDAADINQNGRSEIFVTMISRLNRTLISFVLEWDGAGFKTIIADTDLYYRVIHLPKEKDILLGQKQKNNYPFSSGIYQLEWKNGAYLEAKKQNLPGKINIYEFSYADLLNDGQMETVILANNDRLMLVNRDGDTLWSGSEKYGGSETYLEYPSEYDDLKDKSTDHYYLQQRLHVAASGESHLKGLIVVRNHDLSDRFFSRLRSFDSGHAECLAWNGIGLEKRWQTPTVSGYISDSAVSDLDNDGKPELIFTIIMDEGMLSLKKKSYIVAWKISN